MSDNPFWNAIEDGGELAIHDGGDFEGAIVTTARVVQGGNGLWTPSVHQISKGRQSRRGRGRIAGKLIHHYCPGQVATKAEAVELCEFEFKRLFQETETRNRTL